jgi:hypothetical protein
MPEYNADSVNIASLVENHAKTLEHLHRTCSSAVFSTHNGSLSDLDF